MLEWEAYLCLRVMRKDHVKKLERKHRYIMYILKNVAERTKGMKMKLMKFHAITHMVQDMLLYGVPYEFDTGSNESHHKPSKHAAKLTQRKEETFNMQTATRLTEFLCIELAMEEVQRGNVGWEYFDGAEVWEGDPKEVADLERLDGDSAPAEADPQRKEVAFSVSDDAISESLDGDSASGEEDADGNSASVEEEVETRTGGTRIRIFEDKENGNKTKFKVLGRSKTAGATLWPGEVVDFLNELQKKVVDYIPWMELPVLTEHQRDDVIWRGHPNYRGIGLWTDWALVDWGKEGVVPCRIWCFVKLSLLPKGAAKLSHGGVQLQDGVYAVVECSAYSKEVEEVVQSDLFTPLKLELAEEIKKGETPMRAFYLANVDAFKGPCSVIPDIGGHPSSYFLVKNRTQWSKEFIVWLNQPHKDDEMVISDQEE
jgi:hypothetical protein